MAVGGAMTVTGGACPARKASRTAGMSPSSGRWQVCSTPTSPSAPPCHSTRSGTRRTTRRRGASDWNMSGMRARRTTPPGDRTIANGPIRILGKSLSIVQERSRAITSVGSNPRCIGHPGRSLRIVHLGGSRRQCIVHLGRDRLCIVRPEQDRPCTIHPGRNRPCTAHPESTPRCIFRPGKSMCIARLGRSTCIGHPGKTTSTVLTGRTTYAVHLGKTILRVRPGRSILNFRPGKTTHSVRLERSMHGVPRARLAARLMRRWRWISRVPFPGVLSRVTNQVPSLSMTQA